MGFPVTDVLPGGSQTDEFICSICCGIAESPMYTSCTHVFCSTCLEPWLQQKPHCPKCNAKLMYNQVVPLKEGCPLGWRLLNRMRCRCPLHVDGCKWEGDYGDVFAHLTSSDAHLAAARGVSSAASAEVLNDQANQKFKQRAFKEAVKLYSKAIALVPTVARYHGNRGAAWLLLGAHGECIADCTRAVELDPAYVKAHVRLARAHCEENHFDKAAASLRSACLLQPHEEELQQEYLQVEQLRCLVEAGQVALAAGQYEEARHHLATAVSIQEAPFLEILLARTELALANPDRALKLALGVLKGDKSNSVACSLCARALYLQGDFDKAEQHWREALRLDPDNSEAAQWLKRGRKTGAAVKEARAAVYARGFERGVQLFSEALQADPDLQVPCAPVARQAEEPATAPPPGPSRGGGPLSAAIYAERANALFRIKEYEQCIADTQAATTAQSDHKVALTTRALALQGLGHLDQAHALLKGLHNMDPNDTVLKQRYEKCQFEVRRLKRPDYYALLGVSSKASTMEIKNAYKYQCLQWHPDKHDSEELKAKAEERFKLIGEALGILTEDMPRQLYDEGYDKEAIEERVQAAQRAAREEPRKKSHCDTGCSGGGCH